MLSVKFFVVKGVNTLILTTRFADIFFLHLLVKRNAYNCLNFFGSTVQGYPIPDFENLSIWRIEALS